MKRLEAYADVSFAPSAARSVQGVIVAYMEDVQSSGNQTDKRAVH